jgi:Flp pilus assembly protein TadG
MIGRMRRRGDRGTAAVELAILLPLIVLILGGVIDLGNALGVRVQLQESVQEGANYAAQFPGTPAATKTRVIEASPEVNPGTVTVTCSPPGTSPTVVTVQAVRAHHRIMGLLMIGPSTMTAKASANVMANATCVSG